MEGNIIKILHVVNVPFVLPYFLGNQITFLQNNNITPTIACSASKKLDEFTSHYDIDKFEVEIVRKIDIITDLRSIFKLIKFIRRENFDYVIGHTPKGALLSMIASWLAGTKNRIYFRHGLVFETSTGIRLKLMLFLEKLTSLLATQIVSVSDSVLSYSIKKGFGKSAKNIILNKGTCNGVDIEKYKKSIEPLSLRKESMGINQDNIVIGYVGRLVNDKGISELAEAWKLLIGKYKNITLLLVGPFEERDALSEDVKTFLEQEKTIIITGLVDETKAYYDVMDIFILPSYREGFPTVVLEASAMELPIITTRVTGCVDSIIEHKTGIFSELSPNAIKESISYYIENPLLRLEHGKNGRLWIEDNFKQEVVWEAIKENIYKL